MKIFNLIYSFKRSPVLKENVVRRKESEEIVPYLILISSSQELFQYLKIRVIRCIKQSGEFWGLICSFLFSFKGVDWESKRRKSQWLSRRQKAKASCSWGRWSEKEPGAEIRGHKCIQKIQAFRSIHKQQIVSFCLQAELNEVVPSQCLCSESIHGRNSSVSRNWLPCSKSTGKKSAWLQIVC